MSNGKTLEAVVMMMVAETLILTKTKVTMKWLKETVMMKIAENSLEINTKSLRLTRAKRLLQPKHP